MTVRQKITVWIAGASLLAALGFTSFVFIELVEGPAKLIDQELLHMARGLVARGTAVTPAWSDIPPSLPYPPDRYWIEVRTQEGDLCYRSALARAFSLPLPQGAGGKTSFTVERVVPRSVAQLGQDAENEVAFRVLTTWVAVDNGRYLVTIAKPIEALEEKVVEVLRETSVGLITCTLVILAVSYWLAGRVLQPVAAITALARSIDEGNLARRLPESGGRDELDELARMLNAMLDRLHLSFQRQKGFLANAAHELKSPLALLTLRLDSLLQRADMDEATRSDLVAMRTTVQRMALLVKKLLDLSRLEMRPEPRPEPVDLAGLVREVAAEYRDMTEARGIDVRLDLERCAPVRGDVDMLRRLCINLFDNAVRYNEPQGGKIAARCNAANGDVTLTLGNSGPGVPAGEEERVFEQFQRVDKARSPASGGTGLGLTIARRIVQLHHGRIALASRPNAWTEVTVTLPAWQRERYLP